MTMSGERFRDVPGAVERAGMAFRQLHDRSRAVLIPLRAVCDD